VTWLTCAVITIVTGVPLMLHAAAGAIGWSETAEIPLMALLFLVMVWHVRRRMSALAAARRMAEAEHRAREAQRRFVRLASHELRTPITVARGFTELLRDAALDPGSAEDFDVVLEELEKLDGTVERLLRLARAEDAPLRLAHVELASLLERTARRWQGAVPARRWAVESPRMDIVVDPVRLGLALDSMVENAVRHTDADGLITLRAVPRSGALALEVRDDGPGIAMTELALVFEGFHSTGPHGGTGLGLAIVKAVATAHGGTVEAANAPQGGAVVGLVLPVSDLAEIAPLPRSAAPSDGSVMMPT
jgi:signal transduction histidine kinase